MPEKTKAQLIQEVEALRGQLAEASEQVRCLQAEQAHAARLTTVGEMVLSLVHELRQPLAAIATCTETCARLVRGGVNPTEVLQILDQIATQGGHAAAFLSRLRRFVEHGQPQRCPVQINHAVHEAALLAEPLLRQGQVRLELQLAADLPEILADPVQIEQVLLNLLRNAVEALAQVPPERRQLTVATSAGEGSEVQVAVADTGPGLTPEVVQRLFEPFWTTKPTGMGIGLAISRSILQAHGGRLWARPNGDHGTTFVCALPAASG